MGNWQTVIVATIKKCERKRLVTEKELIRFLFVLNGNCASQVQRQAATRVFSIALYWQNELL